MTTSTDIFESCEALCCEKAKDDVVARLVVVGCGRDEVFGRIVKKAPAMTVFVSEYRCASES